MFHEIDAAVRGLLVTGLPEGTAVSFAAPESSWEPGRDPTVNVFLYQAQEDLQARIAHWTDVRDQRDRVIGRQPPLRWYRVLYLITAWTADVAIEHALLGAALGALAAHDCVPAEHLSGSLAAAGQPVRLHAAPPDLVALPTDLWSAFGIRPRPHLALVVIVPLVPAGITDLRARPGTVDLGVTGGAIPAPNPRPAAAPPAKRIRETW